MDTVIVLFIAEIDKKDVVERIRLSNTPEHSSLQSSITTTRSNHNTFFSSPHYSRTSLIKGILFSLYN